MSDEDERKLEEEIMKKEREAADRLEKEAIKKAMGKLLPYKRRKPK